MHVYPQFCRCAPRWRATHRAAPLLQPYGCVARVQLCRSQTPSCTLFGSGSAMHVSHSTAGHKHCPAHCSADAPPCTSPTPQQPRCCMHAAACMHAMKPWLHKEFAPVRVAAGHACRGCVVAQALGACAHGCSACVLLMWGSHWPLWWWQTEVRCSAAGMSLWRASLGGLFAKAPAEDHERGPKSSEAAWPLRDPPMATAALRQSGPPPAQHRTRAIAGLLLMRRSNRIPNRIHIETNRITRNTHCTRIGHSKFSRLQCQNDTFLLLRSCMHLAQSSHRCS
jgi:hypothetical protein